MEWVVNWFSDTIGKVLTFFTDIFTAFSEWLVQLLDAIPKEIFAGIMGALASVFESIPAPAFMSQANSFFSGIPSNIVFFFQFFAIGQGLAMITSALALRFIIRRIPLIG